MTGDITFDTSFGTSFAGVLLSITQGKKPIREVLTILLSSGICGGAAV